MYCNNCGNELRNDAKFCDACGTAIHQEEITPSNDNVNLVVNNVVDYEPPKDIMRTYEGISKKSVQYACITAIVGFAMSLIGIEVSDLLCGLGFVVMFAGIIVCLVVWFYYYNKLTDQEKEQFNEDYKAKFKFKKSTNNAKKEKKANSNPSNFAIVRDYIKNGDVEESNGKRTCPRCHSTAIQYQTISEKKSMGCGTLLWYFFLFVTILGWFILIPIIFNRKDDVVTYAVCQDCGKRWKVD